MDIYIRYNHILLEHQNVWISYVIILHNTSDTLDQQDHKQIGTTPYLKHVINSSGFASCQPLKHTRSIWCLFLLFRTLSYDTDSKEFEKKNKGNYRLIKNKNNLTIRRLLKLQKQHHTYNLYWDCYVIWKGTFYNYNHRCIFTHIRYISTLGTKIK